MEPTPIQKLVNEVKCHSCYCQMEPPLIQCANGHLYCCKCAKKYRSCSECKTSVGPRRNLLFEKLCFGSILKCSFSVEGCNISGFATILAEHEKCCIFSTLTGGCNDAFQQRESETSGSELMESNRVEGHSLEEIFLAEIECPVCAKRISLPMGECGNGHLVCHKCFSRLEHCPVCRGPTYRSTNVAIERFYQTVDVPCNYASDGCPIRGKVSSVSHHETTCAFAPRSCPLIWNRTCRWQGLDADLVEHCKVNHSDRLSLEPEHKWELENFLSGADITSSFNLFFVYGLLFRCGWDKFEHQARFSVSYLSNEEVTVPYFYELNVLLPNTDGEMLSMTEACTHLEDGIVRFVTTRYISIYSKFLLRYCDENSVLTYTVKIFPKCARNV